MRCYPCLGITEVKCYPRSPCVLLALPPSILSISHLVFMTHLHANLPPKSSDTKAMRWDGLRFVSLGGKYPIAVLELEWMWRVSGEGYLMTQVVKHTCISCVCPLGGPGSSDIPQQWSQSVPRTLSPVKETRCPKRDGWFQVCGNHSSRWSCYSLACQKECEYEKCGHVNRAQKPNRRTSHLNKLGINSSENELYPIK